MEAFLLAVNSLFAFGLVLYARQQVQQQTHPNVVVFTDTRERHPLVIQVIVKNIGAGMARDVKFEMSRTPPAKAFGMDPETSSVVPPMNSGPLVDGIPALGPGVERCVLWGQYGGLKRNLAGDRIYVTCTFWHGYTFLGMPMGRRLKTTSVLEVESFEGTAGNEPYDAKIARQLEKLTNHVCRALPSWGPIHVVLDDAERGEGGSI